MINKLNITSGFKDGRTYLKDTFFTRPFRVVPIRENPLDPSLYVILMSSSPGILDGDEYDIEIDVEENSRFMLQSQAYQRLFNMKSGASQKQHIHLKSGSVFSYVQHPVVPHENSIFKSHSIIRLEDNCSLTLGEIITCGRKHSGEIFRFTHFQNLIEIFYHQKLILKDNILLQPQLVPMDTTGQMEGFTHQATFIYVQTNPGQADMDAIINQMHEMLESEDGIVFGISQGSPLCIVTRVLGNGGEQLFNCLKKMQNWLWGKELIFQEPAAIKETLNGPTYSFKDTEVLL